MILLGIIAIIFACFFIFGIYVEIEDHFESKKINEIMQKTYEETGEWVIPKTQKEIEEEEALEARRKSPRQSLVYWDARHNCNRSTLTNEKCHEFGSWDGNGEYFKFTVRDNAKYLKGIIEMRYFNRKLWDQEVVPTKEDIASWVRCGWW